jgi:hypothetical protein
MTQADSVHSTPPTNTSAKQSRRSILGAIATGAVATLASAIAEPGAAAFPDPIFAAIDAFRRADAACSAVDGDIPDELGDRQWDAYKAVLRTRPTTPGGLVALTTFAREQADWLCVNSSVLSGEGNCEVFAAIDDAAKALSGKAVS